VQAQRAEIVVAQLAGEVALQLVAVLRGAVLDELFVEVGVLVHSFFPMVLSQSKGLTVQ
jgi:hypothetical protein